MLSRFSFLPLSRYGVAVFSVFAAAAYLCLVNLNYTAFWYDEAPSVFFAQQLLRHGDIIGWDGVNLVGGHNGRTLNSEWRDVLPPLTYFINAVGLSLTDDVRVGARMLHALLGVAALGVFYFLLRQFFGASPRLVFFVFMITALFPQLLLYFRQSRYFSFMVLAMVLAVYLYERFWRGKNVWVFAALVAVATLAFFNHYIGGFVLVLTLATHHLLFRARATSAREWRLFALGGVFVAAVAVCYFFWLGIFGSGREVSHWEYTSRFSYDELSTVSRPIKMWFYLRETFRSDWLSWWALVIFVCLWLWQQKTRRAIASDNSAGADDTVEREFSATCRLLLFGLFVALYSGLFAVEFILPAGSANTRYYVAAIPFLLTVKGVVVEWLWRRSRLLAGSVLAVLLLSSAGAAPFNIDNLFTRKPTLGLHLINFIGEIHRPYPDMNSAVAAYLLENAERGDLVYTIDFFDREALTVATESYVQFCCYLDEETPLSREKLRDYGVPGFWGEHTPDWIVDGQHLITPQELATFGGQYAAAVMLPVFFYNTQRPELITHLFTPVDPGADAGVLIYRRIK